MSNPLLVFWYQLFSRREALRRVPSQAHIESSTQASATIFLVMRRMRAPLITLIVIFFISVVGLSLIPGVNPDGQPARISLFESFYFMSYTATTIGFGELPWPFTAAQRLWVTFSIYLSVVGWAYAIGSLLTLIQDRSFRQALALRRFTGRVARLREPFLLLVGYGRAGELLAKDFDALGQQLVVDRRVVRSDRRARSGFLPRRHPGPGGRRRQPAPPDRGRPRPSLSAAGVLALTNDDQTNLAVTMTAALLRPDLPVISRTVSAAIAERMRAFGTPTVVNPFDRFGDHLRLALNAPASYQLLTWLEAGPGAELPERGQPPTARSMGDVRVRPLRSRGHLGPAGAGLEVSVIEPADHDDREPGVIVGDASDPDVLARADLTSAVGLVAGTDNDTTNLSMLATARRLNPQLFLAARQNRPTSAALFEAMQVDALLVPTEVVAHEVYAQISTPMLWRFIQEMPARGDEWAADLIQRLRYNCGRELPALWKIKLDREQAPALGGWLAEGKVILGDLLRSPEDRSRHLRVVPLLLYRDGESVLTPDGETVLAPDDELLFAGEGSERRELESTMVVDSTGAYVLFDQHIPSSWIWRKLSRKNLTPSTQDDRAA